MCGGGGNPISDIVDTGGNIVDTVGSALGDVANFAGDVVTNPIVDTAAAIALGQPELLGLDAAATDAALGSSLVDAGTAGSIGAYPGSDVLGTLQNAVSGYNTYNNINDVLSSDNTDSNDPTDYSQTGYENIPPAQVDPTISQMDPTQGNVTPEDVKKAQMEIDSANSQMEPQGGSASTGVLTSDPWYKGILSSIPTLATNAVKDLTKGLTPLDYFKGAGAAGLGALAYGNQQDINNAILNRYNQMQAQKASKLAQYQTPGATPTLNLGTITPRTAQNVVVMPRATAKDGGVMTSKHSKGMHDLMSEYEHLKSRRKNYAKGNVATPFKMVNPFRGIPINTRNPMYLTPMERKNEEVKSMLSTRRGFAYGTPQSGITSTNTANDKRAALINMLRSNPELLKKMMQARAEANQSQMQQNMQSQMQPEAGDGIASALGFKKGGKIPEIDYRDKGGYVPPIGKKERADDIPAMLSNNEFVFTANAVRNAGKGDVKEGAKKMYALMKHLEGKR